MNLIKLNCLSSALPKPKRMSIKLKRIGLWMLILVFITYDVAHSERLTNEVAEASYQEGRDIFVQHRVLSESEALKALDRFEEAERLSPGAYKVAFSIGAVYFVLGSDHLAVDWWVQAVNRAQKASERFIAQKKLAALRHRLQVAENNTETVQYKFRFKGGGILEFTADEDMESSKYIPVTQLNGSWDDLIASIEDLFPNVRYYRKDPYIVFSLSDDVHPRSAYDRGISDFHESFSKRYFEPNFESPLVILTGSNVFEVKDALDTLYKSLNIRRVNNFLGFFNPVDNLIASTGGDYGYGTLHHELVHAYINNRDREYPEWIEEAFASLYEQTHWDGTEYVPAVNWRMKGLSLGEFPTLEELSDLSGGFFPGIPTKVSRLFLMFLHRNNLDADLLEYGRGQSDRGPIWKLLQRNGLPEEAWQDFAEEQYGIYANNDGHFDLDENLEYIQEMLNEVLGSDIEVDGGMGPITRGKIREFQREAGMRVTGVPNAKTINELEHRFIMRFIPEI